MKYTVSSEPSSKLKADLVVCFVPSDEALFKKHTAAIAKEFPTAAHALEAGDFKGKKDSTLLAYCGQKAPAPRLLLVGLGEAAKCDLEGIRRAAATAGKFASGKKLSSVALVVPPISSIVPAQLGEALVEGATLTAYKFTKYFSGADAPKGNTIKTLTLAYNSKDAKDVKDEKDSKKILAEIKKGAEYAATVAEGVLLARLLANTPDCDMHPAALAQAAQQAAKEAGFTITVLEKKKIAALKMNGLLAVNQGSVRPPVFLVMKHDGGAKGEAPIVLVGKGVTFDTGGISIKPAAGMAEMKADMHGAASVIGTMYAAAKLGVKRNIIGLVPATENMPSGSAIVPGDVITYANGVSAEVDNTDAEGRLILADALIYAQQYKPQAVVDLATLTGACVVALGMVTSGLMGNDEQLKSKLKAAGDYTHEYVCELPLHPEYEELIKSDVADIKNTGGRWAGAITAALFLKRFISTDAGELPWAHLDIAGPAMPSADTAYMPKGGSGVGVRLLCDMLRKW
jgi:leucyl aminopeptidase